MDGSNPCSCIRSSFTSHDLNKSITMHSDWTLINLLLASSAPSTLGGKCNAPRKAGENNNCLGGSYSDCVARNNQLCTGECFGQPAGGAGAPCNTGCTTRNQQYCAGYCMKISNCDDCIKSLKEMGAAGSNEHHKETCSQEGDSYYCNCDSSSSRSILVD